VRLTDEIAGLVVERGVQEETVVFDFEVALLLADSTLAQVGQIGRPSLQLP